MFDLGENKIENVFRKKKAKNPKIDKIGKVNRGYSVVRENKSR